MTNPIWEPGALAAVCAAAGLTLDQRTRRAWMHDTVMSLTRTEFDVLYELVSHPRQTRSTRQLKEAVWGTASVDDQLVRNLISHVRRKLGGEAHRIVTVLDFGYRFEDRRSEDVQLVYPDLQIDPVTRRVWVGNVEREFTPREFELLHTLASRPGEAIHRNELRAAVWGSRTIDDHTLSRFIVRVRLKLAGGRPRIDTVSGHGYRFEVG